MIRKNIVVTGGAGFIGSNLVKKLVEKNHVTVIDDLSTGYIKNIQDLIESDKIEYYKESINNLEFLQKIFKNVNYVFHEAAIPSVPRSIKDPIRSNFVNVQGTLNILVAAKDNHVEKVVYASSSSVYGETLILPKKEEMKPIPMSPYAISKLTGEYYCEVFSKVYSLPTISLRYFNVYGPHQDSTSDYAAVVPKFINNILNNRSPIIYGDGQQTRDFTFVDDVVLANMLAAESNSKGVFNIAYGKRISIQDLANLIKTICKKDIDLTYTEIRSGDIKHSLADISSAKEKLKYEPQYNITRGIKETIKWYQK